MLRIKRFTPGRVVVFILLSFFAVTFLGGVVWMLGGSVKTDMQFYTDSILSFPKPVKIINYVDAFRVLREEQFDLFFMIINSTWLSIGSVVLVVFTNNVVAYTLARFKFPGRDLIYWTYFFTMMLPIVGAMPSALRMYKLLHIYNTPFFLVTKIMAGGSNLFVFYAMYNGVAFTYSEAAYIDGAGHFAVFFKVMLPQSVSIIIAIGVMTFINVWNDYMTPLVYLKDWPTLASGLYKLSVIASRKWLDPYLLAGIIISSIPIIALFVAFQDTLLQINIGGGIKG